MGSRGLGSLGPVCTKLIKAVKIFRERIEIQPRSIFLSDLVLPQHDQNWVIEMTESVQPIWMRVEV